MAASGVIGSLRVNLGLDSAQFTKGMQDSRSAMLGFAARAGTIAGSMVAGMKTAMVAMGIAAIDSATEIRNLSQVANTTPETFQKWAAGAQSVGTEQDKLADILKDVNDRVGDFISTGGGPMKDFFDVIGPKVGVTAQQFRNLSGPEALQLYVSSLEKANVNQQDFTFYMEAMASDSTALLPLLKNGGTAMAEWGAKAQAVGAIMDDRVLASLERGKAALSEMKLAMTGMKNTIGAQAVPAIQALSSAMTAAATFFRKHADEVISAMRTVAGTVLVTAALFSTKYALNVGVKAVQAMIAAATQSGIFAAALSAQAGAATFANIATRALAVSLVVLRGALVATSVGALVVGAGYLVGKFTEIVGVVGGLGKAMTLLGEVASGVWQGIVQSAKAIPTGLSATWELVKSGFLDVMGVLQGAWYKFLVSLSQDALEAGAGGLAQRLAAVADGVGESWDQTRASAEAASARAAELGALASGQVSAGFDAARDALSRLNVTVDDTNAAATTFGGGGGGLAAVSDGAKKAKEKLTDLQRVMKRLRDENTELIATANMSDVDADVWRNQREAGVSAGSADGKQIADLTKMNAGMQSLKDATKEWQSSISSAFSSFLTGATSFKDALGQIISKFAEMAMNAAFQNMFAGSSGWMGSALSWAGIGANANGTNNWRGGLTRINERGNEIVNLPKGTQIIPHDISKRMADRAASGGGSMQVEVVPSPFFDTRVTQISGNVSTQVTRSSARTLDRQNAHYQLRGTTT